MPCTGLCVPGLAACPTPIECGLPPAAPPADPPPSNRWIEELHQVRKDMLAHLRSLPATHDQRWKREAMKYHTHMKLAHRLLRELRAGATPAMQQRIDDELAREEGSARSAAA